ncbi:Agenet-like domain-containing protein [Artemisia annua]|uniref:Agenet-like domain-containing protein n=1 Tax=Artemisia annua TaxID=35608 RepID=A0A2U1NEE4_ARTAN|nr:Agenet-like domain-containing protein [Artemisia annua]
MCLTSSIPVNLLPETQYVLSSSSGSRVSEQEFRPFEKRSQLWVKYEADEFYQKSSQKPHFSPSECELLAFFPNAEICRGGYKLDVRHEISKGKLDVANLDKPRFSPFKGFEEDERERLATVYMDIYSELVGTIKLIDSMDVSMDILAATLKKVEELQRYGFDVTAIEAHLEKLQECHKMKKDLEKHDMELLIVDGEIKELRVKLDESVTAKKNNDNEIVRLDSNLHLVEHKILEVELYFEKPVEGELDIDKLVDIP